MAHNFVKYDDGSKVCSWCRNEKGVDPDGPCQFSAVSGIIILNNEMGNGFTLKFTFFALDINGKSGSSIIVSNLTHCKIFIFICFKLMLLYYNLLPAVQAVRRVNKQKEPTVSQQCKS